MRRKKVLFIVNPRSGKGQIRNAQTSAMVTNCVKTISLSHSAGQQLLSGCYPEFAEILEEIRTYSEDDLCLSAPGFDIRGIQHEKLYSRLYMS